MASWLLMGTCPEGSCSPARRTGCGRVGYEVEPREDFEDIFVPKGKRKAKMPYVNVPNDLSKIKTKIAFNLTNASL